MRFVRPALIGLVVIGHSLSLAGVIDTIRFDPAGVAFDDVSKSVRYDTYHNIKATGRPAVPARSVLYHADDVSPVPEMRGRVLAADTMPLAFTPAAGLPDQITSDDYMVPPVLDLLPAADNRYPARPYAATSQKQGPQTVWSVVLFPIQFLDGDRIIVNREIELYTLTDAGPATITEGAPEAAVDGFYRPSTSPSALDDSSGCPLGHEFIIVTSAALREAFTPLMELKLQTGYDVAVAVTDSIFVYYDGLDQAEALRNYLAACYASGGRYVLLGGDETHVPVRYVYYYDTDTLPQPEYLIMCDKYFADYDGNWDADGDGVWGEPISDNPDIGPEVLSGRLPFSQPWQVTNYTAKLRTYLFNPGGGDHGYLNRAVFFTSDQMRDYFDGGQQYVVAAQFPESFPADCERLAEEPAGNALSPTGPSAVEALTSLNEGVGMVNILAHGRPDGFVIKSADYNQFPKTYMLTGAGDDNQPAFAQLSKNSKPAFYYSIACSQAAFDVDAGSGPAGASAVEELLGLDSCGAVAMVAFTRWGWVGSSYKLMESFYRHLFADAAGGPVEAMCRSHLEYPYYRDQIYGQNYYGDPSLKLYLDLPATVRFDAPDHYHPGEAFSGRVLLGDAPLDGCPVTLQLGSAGYETILSGPDGAVQYPVPVDFTEPISVAAVASGAVGSFVTVYPSIAADADDDRVLPATFELRQNYPNPFNPATTIALTLTRRQQVVLQVFDILGRLVDQPIDQILEAGEHRVVWDGADQNGQEVAGGIYIYRIIAEEGISARKMILLK